MFDMDELMKRAQAASDAASQQLQESMEDVYKRQQLPFASTCSSSISIS